MKEKVQHLEDRVQHLEWEKIMLENRISGLLQENKLLWQLIRFVKTNEEFE